MRVHESVRIICELTEDESNTLSLIAERDGITLEEALFKAMKNFLSKGVQTPNSLTPSPCV